MGSLESRIGRLEERIGPTDGRSPTQELEREAIIAELKQLDEMKGSLRERAEREAEEGHPQRLRAIEELERKVEEWKRRGA